MNITEDQDRFVIGLTGSFGSGCSTLRESLVKLGFEPFSLSKYVKEAWNLKTGKPIDKAPRKELQDVGDKLREDNHETHYLAKIALNEAEGKPKDTKPWVFDNIRNLGELRYFRNKFRDFFLFAVDCSPKTRWDRVKQHYLNLGFNENDFEIDDRRDKYDERTEYGQQVELCVDDADVIIDNDKLYPTDSVQIGKLADKINPYINLVKGELKRPPSPTELYMGIAYTASLMSQCIKRHVGALIVDEKNDAVVSVGYNETPPGIEPCEIKYRQCSRDIYKMKYFDKLENSGQKCPKCDVVLKDLKAPFLCSSCGFDLDKYFISDKALDRCAALHAEEKAILNIGSRNIQGYTIYTTTFPCYSCAKKIVNSRLSSVVFVEPYPDQDSVDLLDEGKVSVRKFEGVKARAYFRVFGQPRRE